MNRVEAIKAWVDMTVVTADYAGRTLTGTIGSVDILGRDILIEEENGIIQWVPAELVIPQADRIAAEFVDPHDVIYTDHFC